MSTPIVVDASATVELLLNTDRGRALRAKIPADVTEHVPEHFFVEVAAAIRQAELHRVITEARAAAALADLLRMRVRRAQVQPLLSEAWTLRANVTVADALYVLLARHRQAPLATADERLGGAPGLGVEIITP